LGHNGKGGTLDATKNDMRHRRDKTNRTQKSKINQPTEEEKARMQNG